MARSCLRDARERGHWLVIIGNTGVGKTHVAERVAQYVGARQIDAWARGWWIGNHIGAPAFLRWDRVADMGEDEWRAIMEREIAGARLVVLDDVGAETDRYRSGLPTARFKAVLDHAEHKWLLVTTNVPANQWKARWGDRTADRMSQARVLDLTQVPSYRQKIRVIK